MKKTTWTLLFLGCFAISIFAQPNLDSLVAALENPNTSSERADILVNLVSGYSYLDLDKAFYYAELSQKELSKSSPEKEIARSNYGINRLRVISASNEDLIKARDLLEHDAATLKGKKYVWKAKSLLAGTYTALRKYEKALEINFDIVEHKDEIAQTLLVSGAYSNIGQLYMYGDDPKSAIPFYKKAVALNREIEYMPFLAISLSNLGSVVEDANEAIGYHLEAIKISKDNNFGVYPTGARMLYLSNVYFHKKKDYKSAMKWIRKAMVNYEQYNQSEPLAEIYANMGSYLLAMNQPDSCFYYLNKAMLIYQDHKDIFNIHNTAELLSQHYKGEKNFEKAFEYLTIAQETGDSLYSNNLADALSENEVKYETLQKETEIAEQKLQIAQAINSRRRLVIGGSLLLLLSGLLFQNYYYRQKRKKEATDLALFTEHKEAEKLREVDRLKSAFFTNISHELRTPLTLVAAPLQDALQSVKPSPLKNTLELAYSNTKKLLRLVNEILDLSKLEAGKIETKLSEVEFLPMIRRLFYSFESIAQVRGLELVLNTNIPKDLKVNLDIEKFEKIINNLLANAVKFTGKGGQVTLVANKEKEHYQFEVIDSGIGISAEELPKVFDRFYQSTSESAPLQGGTGIGLSLAKELAQLLNGDLKVKSELNKGSRFILNIPLESIPVTKVPDAKGAADILKERQEEIIIAKEAYSEAITFTPFLLNGQKPRILIIEDNQDMSDYLFNNLSPDYECVTSFDGLEALNKVAQQDFDLITSDVMMPNLDGFGFREKLIENEKWRQIPFIMLTARALEEDKLRGLRLGIDDYLTKPFSMNEVKARIHNLLSNKLARDNFQKEEQIGLKQEAGMEADSEEKSLTYTEQLVKSAEEYVLKRIDDQELRVDDLAKEVNLSPRQFARTLSKLTGLSPVSFILEIRLQKARLLLEKKKFMTVAEVRYEIGIESASYFTRKFTERFGKNPKTFLE